MCHPALIRLSLAERKQVMRLSAILAYASIALFALAATFTSGH
jgi:hypothetical protein